MAGDCDLDLSAHYNARLFTFVRQHRWSRLSVWGIRFMQNLQLPRREVCPDLPHHNRPVGDPMDHAQNRRVEIKVYPAELEE